MKAALSRRGVLGGAVAASAAIPDLAQGMVVKAIPLEGVAMTATPSPDAELIRLANEHETLGRVFNADFLGLDDHPLAIAAQERRDRNAEQRDKLLAQMRRRPPTTLAGLQAVAAALMVEDLEFLENIYDDTDCLGGVDKADP